MCTLAYLRHVQRCDAAQYAGTLPPSSEFVVPLRKHGFRQPSPALGARLAQSATQRGAALILVLWVVMLLSLIAASFSYTMRAELRQSAQFNERVQARALAEAGLHYAAVHFLQLGSGQQNTKQAMPPWPADGSEQVWPRPNAKVLIRVTDLSGRLDLNNANRELLGKLLLAGGVAKEQVNAVLDAIEDWRDSDDLPHMNGAERTEYQGAGRRYGPKNAPFESVEELLQVLGVEPAVYRRIAPELTVNSGLKGVNPAYASLALLQALAPEGTSPGVLQEYVQQRLQAQLNQQPLPPFPVAIPDVSSNRSMIYAIQSTAQLDSRVSASVEATVLPGRSANLPYALQHWRQSR